MFVHGTDFDRTYPTDHGPIGILAEVQIDGDELSLKDLTIYPVETDRSLKVGVRQMLSIFDEIEQEARIQGFRRCTVEAHRLSGAAPGRIIKRTRRRE
jgi:hypothetical protein